MPGQYAPLPNPRIDPDAEHEMDAAFDDSDDEDVTDEARPLTRPRRSSSSSSGSDGARAPPAGPSSATRRAPSPGGYDFENVDYAAQPPPGSPPPATLAFANDWGNSNGVLPAGAPSRPAPRAGWLRRAAAAVLPAPVARRLGAAPPPRPAGAVGGGTQNDGVFANVTAKPARAVRVQEGDETYLVPEETQREQPPSYTAAQADSAPTYWEATTVHVSGGAAIAGEVVVDGLATGSLFSFFWNGLISVSFQFIGFLLTYLLHTTHAARLGSRAGLGITLIQYGFALRRPFDGTDDSEDGVAAIFFPGPATSEGTSEEQAEYYRTHNTSAPVPSTNTLPEGGPAMPNLMVSESTTEWLAFFLMTVGWFILLTSVLGFWRVKRWERSILASTPAESTPSAPSEPAPAGFPRVGFFNIPGFPGSLRGAGGGFTPGMLRQGLGLRRSEGGARGQEDLYFNTIDLELGPDEDDAEHRPRPGQTQFVIDDTDPQRAQQMTRALVAESRLNVDLRAAGLI